MHDDGALLALLQLADSGFPSGAYTLSNGLETLAAEGWVTDGAALAAVVETLLLERAAEADLPVLLAAHRVSSLLAADGSGDGRVAQAMDAVARLDAVLDRVKLAREEREGSRRVGRRLLAEGARLLPDGLVARYRDRVAADATLPGHAAVAQGLLFAAAGVAARAAALAAASALASGMLTAAIRLGLIGHGEAQRSLLGMRGTIVAAVERAQARDPGDLRPCALALDIAVARHERADARTFAS